MCKVVQTASGNWYGACATVGEVQRRRTLAQLRALVDAMPLVVLCGQPCSGKSRIAAKLAEAFRALGHEVAVVDEPSLHLIRDQSYKGKVACSGTPVAQMRVCSISWVPCTLQVAIAGSFWRQSGIFNSAHLACMSHMLLPDTVSEKNTRGKLRSAVERGLSQKQVVILDSLNNIKVGNSLLKTATVCF